MSTQSNQTQAPPPTIIRAAPQYYSEDERPSIRQKLIQESVEKLGRKPFDWQLDASLGLLMNKDVILDVGTGSGKSLTFTLPLLLDRRDIVMVISPLTALMIEQASAESAIRTVAVCADTFEEVGREVVYNDILEGKFQQIIVSPEIVISSSFRKSILNSPKFTSNLRAVCIDEAHCITLWGGSFRPDYASLGLLRGRLPKQVPIMVASATFPAHVLDDVRAKIQLSKDALYVGVSNDRPNVALSVRVMQHAEETYGDMAPLLPEDVQTSGDIPITAVFCNQRRTAEMACDAVRQWLQSTHYGFSQQEAHTCVAFYHAGIGSARKRSLEAKLRTGEVRFLFCTDAVGMGCDLRNIQRVVLWGIPPSFSALVQRAGRAVRDLTQRGEAILFITKAALKKGLAESEVFAAVERAADEGEALNLDDSEVQALADEGLVLAPGQQVVSLTENVGARVVLSETAQDEAVEAGAEPKKGSKRRNKATPAFNSLETRYINLYISGDECRRLVWNKFFQNDRKLQLSYPTTTLFRESSLDAPFLCCDVCNPAAFSFRKVPLDRPVGLTRGRKRQLAEYKSDTIKSQLAVWRETKLFPAVYGSQSSSIESISAASLMDDSVIAQIAGCGKYLVTPDDFRRNARWSLAFDENDELTAVGRMLLDELSRIYDTFPLSESESSSESESNDLDSLEEQDPVPAGSGASGRQTRSQARLAHEPTEEAVVVSERGRGRGRARARGRPRGRGRGTGRRA